MPMYHGDQVTLIPLATPDPPTLTRRGSGGETTYSYLVVAMRGDGHTEASEAATMTNGAASLNASHAIDIKPPYVQGATSFDIYRTAGGTNQGRLGNMTAAYSGTTQTASYRDRGQSATEGDAPETNTTGTLILSAVSSGALLQVGDDNEVAALTLASFIANPTGGSTVDAEARAAIDSILTLLQAAGIMQGD